MRKNLFARSMNALMILVLMGILAGAYFQQYYHQEIPCPLCLLQRLAMVGIGCALFLNLRFGIHTFYYVIAWLFVILGRIISLRQIALHICPGFPRFGLPVFGLELYTWAYIAFNVSSFAIGILWFLYPNQNQPPDRMNWFEKFASLVLFLITVANILTTFAQCGFGPCEDPLWPPPGLRL